jgi:hypothetical protein
MDELFFFPKLYDVLELDFLSTASAITRTWMMLATLDYHYLWTIIPPYGHARAADLELSQVTVNFISCQCQAACALAQSTTAPCRTLAQPRTTSLTPLWRATTKKAAALVSQAPGMPNT